MNELREKTLTTARLEDGMTATGAKYPELIDSSWQMLKGEHVALSREAPSLQPELAARIALIDRRLAFLKTERAYAAEVEVRGLRRDTGTRSNFGLPAEGVFGEVKNNGEQTITVLELQLKLLDKAGKPVGDRTVTIAFPGVKDPLLPNYTRPFGIAVDDPPSDWVSVSASVSQLQLSREGLRFPEEPDWTKK